MRLIDADALRREMYHEAFETDTDMQRWDSGCWVRYKMFENAIEKAPTIEAEPFNCSLEEFGECSYKETGCSDCKVKEKVRNAIDKSKPKHGRWIEDEYGFLICSECGNTAEYLPILGQIETPYCSECGAKMDL